MFCSKCGAAIGDKNLFCTKCGHRVKGAPQATPSPQPSARAAPQISLSGRPTSRTLIMAGGVVLSLVVIAAAVHISGSIKRQEQLAAAAASQAAAQALLEEDMLAIEDTLAAYASAMQNLDFEYAAEFWVPKRGNSARSAADLLAEIPYGGVLKGALPLLGRVANFKYEVVLLDEISLSGDRAIVTAGIAMDADIVVDFSAGSYTVSLRKIDGVWLIESIKE